MFADGEIELCHEKMSFQTLLHLKNYTLFSFIITGLKFCENFLGTFRERLISRLRRKIVFAGNLILWNWRLSDFTKIVR